MKKVNGMLLLNEAMIRFADAKDLMNKPKPNAKDWEFKLPSYSNCHKEAQPPNNEYQKKGLSLLALNSFGALTLQIQKITSALKVVVINNLAHRNRECHSYPIRSEPCILPKKLTKTKTVTIRNVLKYQFIIQTPI